MTLAASDPTSHAAYRAGALALFLSVAAIVTALAFEHLGGYAPCELCQLQRYAYYAGAPGLFLALVALTAGQRRLAIAVFGLVALAFLANAVLGAYHAGVEWHFWAGPSGCTGSQALTANAGNMLEALKQTNVVRCDEAAWRFMGISFAGWNVVCSLLIVWLSIRAARDAAHAI
ncbi:MAG TPA: disulfide bond formation protein B [Hyphomicrobium sp.]|nr:disulfide bond formation protein B [Hyphomicrobium sp.]